MMRMLSLLILSLILLGCAHQLSTAIKPYDPPKKLDKKLDFASRYLALSAYQQAGSILASISTEDQMYLTENSIDYLRIKGIYLAKRASFLTAEQHYQSALKNFPNDVVLMNNFGVLLIDNREFERACDYFKRAVLLSSQNSFSGLINLSRCELASKKVDKALMHLKRAKEINNLPYIGLLTELNLALILGDLSGARQSYNKIQAEQKIAPYTEHRNEYECLLQQYNAAELDSTYYSSSRPPFACVVQGIEYGIWNSRKQ